MTIRTFRGAIADGGIDTINLHTNDGTTGYKVIKFQTMPLSPGASAQELVTKIYTIPQTTATATVDFSDPTLLACTIFNQSSNAWTTFETVIFDNMTFNQDIHITCQDTQNAAGCNYYIELELMDLDKLQAQVASLKDLRNNG